MTLQELLHILQETAEKNHLRTPYICGGIPRDLVLDALTEINDVDITTGNVDVGKLADLFAEAVGVNSRKMKDGHKKVVKDGVSFDFSSNFMYEGIDRELMRRGIQRPSNLLRETFSRDFTVNCLLMPLDFSRVIDFTGQGLGDVQEKLLRCPVDCDLSFKNSPIRMIRAYFYAAKYGFKIADEVREAVKKNLGLLKDVDTRYASEKVNAIMRLKPEMLNDLIEDGVLSQINLTKDLTRSLIQSKRLLDVI